MITFWLQCRISQITFAGSLSRPSRLKFRRAATAFRSTNRPLEDPFGGGVETSFEDNSNAQPEPVAGGPILNPPVQNPPVQNPAAQNPAAQNPAAQGLIPGQPGVQPECRLFPPTPTNPLAWLPNNGAAARPSTLQSLSGIRTEQPAIAVLDNRLPAMATFSPAELSDVRMPATRPSVSLSKEVMRHGR